MPWTSKHLQWLLATNIKLKTKCGKEVEVLEFRYESDDGILSAWAKHFRNHYCADSQIDSIRDGTGLTRQEYLTQLKFPDAKAAPGPSIRAGDFAEILVADYFQFRLNYVVPRTRYFDKTIRNESTKGSDILAFSFFDGSRRSPKDILAIIEVKASLSDSPAKNVLQEAIDHSARDQVRKAESLNATRQKLISQGERSLADQVKRFQSKVDFPFEEMSGGAAVITTANFNTKLFSQCNAAAHPNQKSLKLIVIHGKELMALVNALYVRATNEA